MVKAIIYDLDGVLVDATEWHYEALNRALHVFGFIINRQEHVSFYNGLPTRKKLEVLSKEKGFPLALKEFVNSLKQVYTRQEILRNCTPHFEKQFMLAKFRKEGVRQIVCSNAVRDSVDLMLRQSGLMEYLEFFIGNDEVQKPKPDPQMYQIAMEKLGLKPEEVVIVEDSPHGIEAARASGAHVCVVSGFKEVRYDKLKSFIDSIGKQEGE
ncbi:HAD family phosphatase [Candidatus Micrarchaeota archaeon]|nr:HAD family phosphatase [Candidatus Micrarchaeota archaeon]